MIHATAGDLGQAVGDLHADWGVEHHQRWVADTTARPGHEPEPARPPASPTNEPATVPIDVRRADAHHQLAALERDYRNLHAGTGRWHHTIQGDAARRLRDARQHFEHAQQLTAAPSARRRDRRAAVRSLPTLSAVLAAAERRWQAVGQPAADQIRAHLNATRRQIDSLDSQELIQRLDQLQQPATTRTADLDLDISM